MSGVKAIIPLLIIIALLATACSSRVAGMRSPVAHDYGEINWQPLTEPVSQPFIVSPGYSATIGNDAETTPEQLLSRLDNLPGDARSGTLSGIRAGIRPVDQPISEAADVRIRISYAPDLDPRFTEPDYEIWPEDHGWLPELNRNTPYEQTFVSPYPNLNGLLVRTATFQGDLTPGTAIVGQDGADVLASPAGTEIVSQLEPGQEIEVTGATEGRATVILPDGTTGYVPLDQFGSLPDPARSITDPLTVELFRNGDDQPVRTVTIPPDQIHDNAHLSIRFDTLENAAGEQFTARFTMAAEPGSGITLRHTGRENDGGGQLTGNGDPVDGDLVFRPLYGDQGPVFESSVMSLPRDGDWVTIEDPPELRMGTVAELTLVPADGSTADGWEFGTTHWHSPYGGWPARIAMESTADAASPATQTARLLDEHGAILFETVYERDVNARSIAGNALGQFEDMSRDDPLFTLGFTGLLLATAVFTLVTWRQSRQGVVDHGR